MTADLTRKGGALLVKAVARRIAKEAPTLEDLRAEDLEKLARAVVVEALKDDLRTRAKIEKIDYQGERETFLSRVRSEHTGRAYRAALDRLQRWCLRQGVEPVELTPALADDWIETEKAHRDRPSPATVRLRVSAASAFFTWMERRHAEVRNPFRGTRSRPVMKRTRGLQVPSEDEIRSMLDAAKAKDLITWAAILTMSKLGLRVGALAGFCIDGGHYMTTSKGKELRGAIPEELRQALEKAGLRLRFAFGGLSPSLIADRVRLITTKLYRDRKVAAVYSVHDLRHAFAVRLHRQTKDIYAVKNALGHANVAVTEAYLRSLSGMGGSDQ
jgi:site-specific recombinase XerD